VNRRNYAYHDLLNKSLPSRCRVRGAQLALRAESDGRFSRCRTDINGVVHHHVGRVVGSCTVVRICLAGFLQPALAVVHLATASVLLACAGTGFAVTIMRAPRVSGISGTARGVQDDRRGYSAIRICSWTRAWGWSAGRKSRAVVLSSPAQRRD
jgi:hypothetical protein